jgi:hypothetical protein
MSGEARTEKYRYPVDDSASEITPLASIEVFWGNTPVKVLNVSLGGIAFLIDDNSDIQAGDPIDVSVAVRGRAFPMQLEIRQISDRRVSSSFLNPPPIFISSLREFLAPKFLGNSLEFNRTHKDLAAALELVEGAENYEAYTGQNQTGVFMWIGTQRRLLKMVAVSREHVLGWDPINGIRTGKLNADSGLADVQWDRVMEIMVFNYICRYFTRMETPSGRP